MTDPQIELVKASEVEIGERVRSDPGKIRKLMDSLESAGQIQPIVLDGRDLVAGFRRLTACMLLESEDRTIAGQEPGMILAIQKANLDPYQKLLIEYEENNQRKAFTKGEDALALSRLKVALEELDGKEMSGGEFAKMLGYSKAHVSMSLRVADAIENDGRDELRNAPSIAGAYKKLRATEKLEALTKRVEAAETSGELDKVDYSEFLTHGDAVKWIKDIPDGSIDLVHFDPPWGIGIDSYDRNNNYGSFDDSADTGTQISKELIPELYRVLKEDTYALVWFGIQFYQPLFERLSGAGFKVNPVPFVWHKPNKTGSQNDPTRTTINQWEPLFICEKGEPRMYKFSPGNVLSYNMPSSRIHFAQKNEELLRELLERFSYGRAVILDPTFGSGAVFVAAQRLGRVFFGCEKDRDNYDRALSWLSRSRLS